MEHGQKGDVALTTEDPATTPYATHGTCEAVASVCSHGRLDHFQRLRNESVLREMGDKSVLCV